jgi:hypothetical protein
MTMPTRAQAPLYPSEKDVARFVLGEDAKRWPEIAVVLEREGLPRVDPITGRRYWPAVRAWFDGRHGLLSYAVPAAVDGDERW